MQAEGNCFCHNPHLSEVSSVARPCIGGNIRRRLFGFLALRVFLRHRHRTGESYKRGIYNRLGLIVGFLLCARVFCFWLVYFVLFFVFFHFSLVLFSKGRQVRNSLHSLFEIELRTKDRTGLLWTVLSWELSCGGGADPRGYLKNKKTKQKTATKQTTAGFCPLPPPPH